MESLGKVLMSCSQVPLDTEFESLNSVSPLHSAALEALEAVQEVALEHHHIVPEVFDVFIKFGRTSLLLNKTNGNKDNSRFREKFSLLGEACMETMAKFYEKACQVNNMNENEFHC